MIDDQEQQTEQDQTEQRAETPAESQDEPQGVTTPPPSEYDQMGKRGRGIRRRRLG